MLTKIQAWLASHSITTHSIAGAAVTLVALYRENQGFHDAVLSVYAKLPHGLHDLVAMIIAAALIYYRGQTPPSNQAPSAK